MLLTYSETSSQRHREIKAIRLHRRASSTINASVESILQTTAALREQCTSIPTLGGRLLARRIFRAGGSHYTQELRCGTDEQITYSERSGWQRMPSATVSFSSIGLTSYFLKHLLGFRSRPLPASASRVRCGSVVSTVPDLLSRGLKYSVRSTTPSFSNFQRKWKNGCGKYRPPYTYQFLTPTRLQSPSVSLFRERVGEMLRSARGRKKDEGLTSKKLHKTDRSPDPLPPGLTALPGVL